MRLSDVLSKAPDTAEAQVEGFLGTRRIGWGQHKKIRVGKVVLNFFCRKCSDIRTFMSGDELSCLVAGERRSVSTSPLGVRYANLRLKLGSSWRAMETSTLRLR